MTRCRGQAGGVPGSSLFWAIQVNADSTSARSLAVNPSILTPVASAFFLASSAAATECTHTNPRRTLAVNFCCFSSVIYLLLKNSYRSLRCRDGAVHPVTVVVERAGDHPHVLIGLIPAPLLNGLANSRQGLYAISGMHSRRIDQVLIPLSTR